MVVVVVVVGQKEYMARILQLFQKSPVLELGTLEPLRERIRNVEGLSNMSLFSGEYYLCVNDVGL